MRELQQDLGIAQLAAAPGARQRACKCDDPLIMAEVREPVDSPLPLPQFGCVGPALEQVDVQQAQGVVDQLLLDRAPSDLISGCNGRRGYVFSSIPESQETKRRVATADA